MSQSIAVVGAGPGLGLAVARRWAQAGYQVVLIARRAEPLDAMRHELEKDGATVHVVTADVSSDGAGVDLAHEIRARVGTPDVVYYAPGIRGYVPVADLTSADLRGIVTTALYTLVDLVHEFLPEMSSRRSGTVLTACAPSAVVGMPQLSATAVLAAQRNYLQALQGGVSDQNIFVGRLYIGATIENSAFHTQQQNDRAAGRPVIDLPTVDPAHLAELLWTMHAEQGEHELLYPADLFTL